MQNHEEMIKQDPSILQKGENIEIYTKEWLKKNGRLNFSSSPSENLNKYSSQKNGGGASILSLCGYDNNYFTTISAPTSLGQIVSPSPNCTFGGEYITVSGLVAGNIYRISTCGVNNFDTQISIYTSGGGYPVAHNDDWCGSQSQVYFNPIVSGNYDILIDEFNCASNSLCASIDIELFYTPRSVITIPVVFHIIHNGEPVGVGANISTAQILSQLDVLNEDFRRLNTDIYITPSAFRGASDDALIEFCLAQQDELGNPTNGIERIQGVQSSYDASEFNTLEKPYSVWDRDKYMNFWTCNIPSLSGYATFPSGPANLDGVVIKYDQVGNTGNVNPPFDLGRTATHEVGHWLNLRHIWGDAPGCSIDDSIPDTPLQDVATPIGTCPTFPVLTNSCSPNYPGIMFYNQMDYSGDVCLTMFTVGQTSRMDAALFGPRASLLFSNGCNPSNTGIYNNSLSKSVTVYPTINNGNLTVEINLKQQQGVGIEIYTTLGEKIWESFQQNMNNISIPIDLSNNSDGVYFVQITSNSQTTTKRIIINKSR